MPAAGASAVDCPAASDSRGKKVVEGVGAGNVKVTSLLAFFKAGCSGGVAAGTVSASGGDQRSWPLQIVQAVIPSEKNWRHVMHTAVLAVAAAQALLWQVSDQHLLEREALRQAWAELAQ